MIQTRKKDLLVKSFKNSEPKIISVKPAPKYTPNDIGWQHRNLRRGFNHNGECTTKWFKNQYILNVERIWVDDKEFFDLTTHTGLSRKGYKELWKAIDLLVKDIDRGRA